MWVLNFREMKENIASYSSILWHVKGSEEQKGFMAHTSTVCLVSKPVLLQPCVFNLEPEPTYSRIQGSVIAGVKTFRDWLGILIFVFQPLRQ